MRNLGKYVKKYGILYVVAIAAMVVSILLDAASPQITRHIIDDVIVGGKMEMLMRLLLGLLGIGLGRAIFQYMKEFIFDYSASGIGSSLRKDLFDHIQTLSMGYFDSGREDVLVRGGLPDGGAYVRRSGRPGQRHLEGDRRDERAAYRGRPDQVQSILREVMNDDV